MQGAFWVLSTEQAKNNCLASIQDVVPGLQKPVSVKIQSASAKRSDAQNALAHLWFKEISDQGGEYTEDQIKCLAKKHYGVPILMAEEPKFVEVYNQAVQGFPTYELEVFKLLSFFPVTSIMTTDQMARFLTQFCRVSSQKFKLTDPKFMGLNYAVA